MVAAGNVYDKYGTRNPIERRLVGGFLGQVRELVERTGAREAHEVGCGEGELSLMLARRGLTVRGTDISAEVIEEARRRAAAAGLGVSYRAAPIESLDPARDSAELIICCEVLEHLDDAAGGPRDARRPGATLAAGQRPPRAPVAGAQPGAGQVRARARQHARAPRALVAERLRRLPRAPGWKSSSVHSPLPWTMALCRAGAE